MGFVWPVFRLFFDLVAVILFSDVNQLPVEEVVVDLVARFCR